MQRLEVSGAVQLIYKSLGVKGLSTIDNDAVRSFTAAGGDPTFCS